MQRRLFFGLVPSLLVLSVLLLVTGACHRESSSSTGSSDPSGSSDSVEEIAAGKEIFVARCSLCHPIGVQSAQGPGLGGVVGRPAGTLRGFTYTPALKASKLTWDKASLDSFLMMPAVKVPGTTMAVAVPGVKDRAALIAYLGSLQASPTPVASGSSSADTYVSGAAFGDYRLDAPGVHHKITVADLPPPFASPSSANRPSIVARPDNANPRVPEGFSARLFATGLQNPRQIRVAPNGDIFIAETSAGQIRILRAKDGATEAETKSVFAKALDQPFGIAFYPPGPNPKYVYVANTNSVVRFAYQSGDLTARATLEVIVPKIAASGGGHTTRDIAFSPDGRRMLISVGSSNNVGEEMHANASEIASAEKERGLGAAWGDNVNRADILVASPDGSNLESFANGIRNCVTLLAHGTDFWCATNERDGLGDDLVPDYVTRVKEGAFYGWPWYYLGEHEDPRHAGERRDLLGKIAAPDVLVQPHSAALGAVFYDAKQFRDSDRGALFVAFHGSWNRARRTSPKVVKVLFANGVPTGDYEDFMTGFVVDDANVWARPVGVAVAHDGALLVTEDGNDTVWRVSRQGLPK